MSSAAALEQLKDLLGDKLCAPEQVKAPEGVATGLEGLDRFVLWNGLPKGALTLLGGVVGTGATSLFIEASARVIGDGKWAAWINGEIPLSPLPLAQKGVNLDRFVSIQPDVRTYGTGSPPPQDPRKLAKAKCAHLFFILQELLSSSIFELVGCDLGPLQFAEHQLRKLQAQARDANIALVLVSQNSNVARLASARRSALIYRGSAASVFSLIVHFEKKRLIIERALHRQTPHFVPRSFSYARFTNFSTQVRANSHLLEIEHAGREPHSLSSSR